MEGYRLLTNNIFTSMHKCLPFLLKVLEQFIECEKITSFRSRSGRKYIFSIHVLYFKKKEKVNAAAILKCGPYQHPLQFV